jgi:hypothetical protein
VALQARAAAALVAVEGGQVVEPAALLAEALPPALANDAVHLRSSPGVRGYAFNHQAHQQSFTPAPMFNLPSPRLSRQDAAHVTSTPALEEKAQHREHQKGRNVLLTLRWNSHILYLSSGAGKQDCQ